MKTLYTVNGVSYEIEYQPSLSSMCYTECKVYYIRTKDKDYDHAKKNNCFNYGGFTWT